MKTSGQDGIQTMNTEESLLRESVSRERNKNRIKSSWKWEDKWFFMETLVILGNQSQRLQVPHHEFPISINMTEWTCSEKNINKKEVERKAVLDNILQCGRKDFRCWNQPFQSDKNNVMKNKFQRQIWTTEVARMGTQVFRSDKQERYLDPSPEVSS